MKTHSQYVYNYVIIHDVLFCSWCTYTVVVPNEARHYLHSHELFRGVGGTEATKRRFGQLLSNDTRYGYKTYSSAISLSALKA